MKICLVDADSVIPNLALMKISTYHKSKGNKVTLLKANLPYYPSRKKKLFKIPSGYDKVYASIVFEGNRKYIIGKDVVYGGTGVDLTTSLPGYVESCEPDYSIYPENDTSYGFISRGCIRNCSFCFVPKKEGKIRQVATVDDIVRHKKVKFMDNNFLALPNHKEILQELIDKKIKCCFNQGLDIRLLDEENSRLLSQVKYLGRMFFAFDDYKFLRVVERKVKLLKWVKPYACSFFVYTHPDMCISEVVKRVEWLDTHKFVPYIMRDIDCWSSLNNNFYVDLASYCNQPHIFIKMTFKEYLSGVFKRGCSDKKRLRKSFNLYYDNM